MWRDYLAVVCVKVTAEVFKVSEVSPLRRRGRRV